MVNFVCENGGRDRVAEFGEVIMSESLALPTKSAATRSNAADTRVIAQVEKWMAVIREIKQEQPAKN
jgi:preprotein translocase subunit SecA